MFMFLQSITQVLNRVTCKANTFDSIVAAEIQGNLNTTLHIQIFIFHMNINRSSSIVA